MTHRLLFFFLAWFLVAPAAGGVSFAYSIDGRVVNGTTGETALDVDVTLVNPAAGTKEERTVRAVGGRFTLDGLDGNVADYILKLVYKDVRYDYIVRPSDGAAGEKTVYVYEHSTSWDSITVSVPRFTVNRHGDHLQLERVYEIDNKKDPPATVTGEEGYFKFALPEGESTFHALFVSSLGVPVEQTPVATGQRGVYRVDYPLRPGVTRIGISYTVPYTSGRYAHSENILYDTQKIFLTWEDSGLNVTSDTNTLVEVQDPHGSRAFVIENLKRGDRLDLFFTGGSGGPVDRSAQPEITIVPNRTETVASRAMLVLLAALLLLFVMAVREPGITGGQKPLYEKARDVLLERMARLDDLHDTGAVTAAAYYARRAEMKNQAAAAIYRSGGSEPDRRGRKSRQTGKPRK